MKVELAFDIMQDGFLRVKGQVCEYDDTFGAQMVADGHFERHPDTPARVNSALYSLGCTPTPPAQQQQIEQATEPASVSTHKLPNRKKA